MAEVRALDAGAQDVPLLAAIGSGRPVADVAVEERARISARLTAIGEKEARRRAKIADL